MVLYCTKNYLKLYQLTTKNTNLQWQKFVGPVHIKIETFVLCWSHTQLISIRTCVILVTNSFAFVQSTINNLFPFLTCSNDFLNTWVHQTTKYSECYNNLNAVLGSSCYLDQVQSPIRASKAHQRIHTKLFFVCNLNPSRYQRVYLYVLILKIYYYNGWNDNASFCDVNAGWSVQHPPVDWD